MWTLAFFTAAGLQMAGTYDHELECHMQARYFKEQGVVSSCIQTQVPANAAEQRRQTVATFEAWARNQNAPKR